MTKNSQGIIWALVATALFSVEAAIAKMAVTEFHVLQILFFRQLFVFGSALPAIKKSFPHSLATQYPGIHAARLTGAFTALSAGIWAVSVLPLTTATTLSFAKVFFVALLALIFLSEQIGAYRGSAVVVGFLGVVIVMRPGLQGLADPNVLIAIVGALGAAVAQICVRKLSQTESTATLLTYQAVFVGSIAGVSLFWLWVTPTLSGLLMLAGIGILATAGQWLAVKALRLSEAGVVANVQYVQLVYAAVLGFVIFSETPDAYTLIGAMVIIGSSIILFNHESRRQQVAR
ncbi:MAG: DMT family transporter [Burkholderiaceae bacterium]